jgi:hypothetical protein
MGLLQRTRLDEFFEEPPLDAGLRTLPEFFDPPRRRIGGTKEIGEDAEPILDFTLEAKRARWLLRQLSAHEKSRIES